ncbi:MAG: COG1470 family protein [Methanosarcinales archaeon]
MRHKVPTTIALFMLISLLAMPAVAIENVNARFVTNVRGIQDYDLHWNDRFPPNSTLKLYIEALDVSHRRVIALDYLVLITDPEGVLLTGYFLGRRYLLSPYYSYYGTNDYIVYSKEIPDEWIDGLYTADIYVFDLTNDSVVDHAFNVIKENFTYSGFVFVEKNVSENITTEYETGTTYAPLTTETIEWYPDTWDSDLADLILINRTNATFEHTVRHFFVDRHASKYPLDRFHIEDLRLACKEAAPGAVINASVNVTNTYFEAGIAGFSVEIDNTTVSNLSVGLNATERKTVNFTISNDTVGEHIITIVPSTPRTLGFDLKMPFIITEEEAIIPPAMVVNDLQIDKLRALTGEEVTITLTVTNTGGSGSAPVKIKVNDEILTRTAIANRSETISLLFNLTPVDPGDYRVEVPGTDLAKLFFVEEGPIEEEPPSLVERLDEKAEEQKPELRAILILSVIVVLLYALRTYLRWKT